MGTPGEVQLHSEEGEEEAPASGTKKRKAAAAEEPAAAEDASSRPPKRMAVEQQQQQQHGAGEGLHSMHPAAGQEDVAPHSGVQSEEATGPAQPQPAGEQSPVHEERVAPVAPTVGGGGGADEVVRALELPPAVPPEAPPAPGDPGAPQQNLSAPDPAA